MKKGFSAVEVMVLFIAGIIFIVIVLGFASNAYGNIVYGACWQKTDESLATLKSDMQSQAMSSTDKIYMGDCIGAIVIFNRGFSDASADPAFRDFISAMEKQYCQDPKDNQGNPIYKSYILMIPWKTLNAASDVGTWQQLKNKFGEYTKLQMFQKPDCFGVERQFSDNTFYLPKGAQTSKDISTLNTKNVQFCLSVTKTSATSGGSQYQLEDVGTSCLNTK